MFDLEKFDLKLNTDVIGRNFIYAEEVPSANTELLTGNKSYKKHGTVLFAEKQIVGKGRKNRTWYSDAHLNLTFSILIKEPKYFQKKINILNFVASLALAVSIENLYQLKTELKWPNDVLVGPKKLAGILIEAKAQDRSSNDEMIQRGITRAREEGFVQAGDVVVVTAGVSQTTGSTNLIRVVEVD